MMPYIVHNNTPIVNIKYIPTEIPVVFLVFITFTACEINEQVVKIAAIKLIHVCIIISIPFASLFEQSIMNMCFQAVLSYNRALYYMFLKNQPYNSELY